MYRNNRARSQGFTLIEVLVAIAIFASLSVGAYQVLNQVQRSNEISMERSERLKALQRALVFMDNDFRQMALRQSRTNGEEPSAMLLQWKDYLLDSDAKGVMFVRSGWHNPQQQFPRGEVSKVGYRIKDKQLQRVWWRYIDTPAGQEGIVMPLLDGVDSFEMRFFDGKKWQKNWETKLALPQAVALNLELEDYGKIERIYLTSGGALELAEEQKQDG
ncbi:MULTISPECIES: type II secretion system minor pseudopilin GspJ [Vibrio]|uniref:Type II secretion system protein J n=1 Tax=Vibrio bivalvicida TaxID=1276888 RepID=A0A177Y655_9VIBR|nr:MULTISPECIES: type II secretion system minor pseudopilin GspJ [Vibrio]KLN65522.1 general secretion pathway protein GspJ [Vibrio sp. VPAP30]OAJ96086.1 type II secretion system protein GspJ [Vibrio bivalvicida]